MSPARSAQRKAWNLAHTYLTTVDVTLQNLLP
jgi:hypothetical protein